MTKDDIIELAKQAGFVDGVVEIVGLYGFMKFANLVAAAEREKLNAPWVSLTDDEIKEIIGPWSGERRVTAYTRWLFDKIDAKLKEKNHDAN